MTSDFRSRQCLQKAGSHGKRKRCIHRAMPHIATIGSSNAYRSALPRHTPAPAAPRCCEIEAARLVFRWDSMASGPIPSIAAEGGWL